MRVPLGVVIWLDLRLFIRPILRHFARVDSTPFDHAVYDGQVLPVAGGLTVLRTPGHCARQVCLLWLPHGGTLLAADVATSVFVLGRSVTYEERGEGKRPLRTLAALDFRVACCDHGKAIIGDAASQFRRRWPIGSAPDAEPGATPDRGGR